MALQVVAAVLVVTTAAAILVHRRIDVVEIAAATATATATSTMGMITRVAMAMEVHGILTTHQIAKQAKDFGRISKRSGVELNEAATTFVIFLVIRCFPQRTATAIVTATMLAHQQHDDHRRRLKRAA